MNEKESANKSNFKTKSRTRHIKYLKRKLFEHIYDEFEDFSRLHERR